MSKQYPQVYPRVTWEKFKLLEKVEPATEPDTAVGYLVFMLDGQEHKIPCVVTVKELINPRIVEALFQNGLDAAYDLIDEMRRKRE